MENNRYIAQVEFTPLGSEEPIGKYEVTPPLEVRTFMIAAESPEEAVEKISLWFKRLKHNPILAGGPIPPCTSVFLTWIYEIDGDEEIEMVNAKGYSVLLIDGKLTLGGIVSKLEEDGPDRNPTLLWNGSTPVRYQPIHATPDVQVRKE